MERKELSWRWKKDKVGDKDEVCVGNRGTQPRLIALHV